MLKKLGVLAVVLLVVVAALPGVSAQEEGKTFIFGSEGNPINLDPAVVTDGISFRVARQGCENLLEFESGTTTPGPGLAQSWEVSEDGLTWTLQLVEGATFHDGTPFNAEAVVWNFDRWRLTSHPQHFPEAVFEYYEAQFGGFDDASNITSVEATGEYEVTINLREPMGAFLNNLAMDMFSIASPAAVEAAGPAYGTPEFGYVCTGPYKFVEWVNDDHVTLELNENYWGEISGNVSTIILRIIPDTAARLAALQAGEIDAYERPALEDIDVINSTDGLRVELRPSFNTLYLAFSYRIKEFQDPLVRKAISLAINRQEIVDAFFLEGTDVANTMNPPSIAIGFNADVVTPYDPEQAKALLAEAGYPDGLSEVTVMGVDENGNVTDEEIEKVPVRVYYMPVTRPYNPNPEAIGTAQVSYLQEIGIDAQLETIGDWAAYLDARSNGELLGLYQLGWTGDNGDPDNFIGYFYTAADAPLAREGFYQNAEVAALLQRARVSTITEERDAIYKQVEQMMADNADRVYVAHGPVPLAFRDTVVTYIASPTGSERFKDVVMQ
ncbi:MAG: ABC transporter substrate-binding protein [Anaerolineae bacterium]|nr:ABC transporter substrate-binding protein [Anaerolineae bacterium]